MGSICSYIASAGNYAGFSFNIFAAAFLLGLLIFITGIWLRFVTFGDLAIIIWGLGISSLGLVTSAFALFVIYVSKAIVAYFVGLKILESIAPQATENNVLPLSLVI